MALSKAYRRTCEGRSLGRRLGIHLGQHPDHVPYGEWSQTAADAMSWARKNGWRRIGREFPISVSHSSSGNTTIIFDLCPACVKSLDASGH